MDVFTILLFVAAYAPSYDVKLFGFIALRWIHAFEDNENKT